MTSLLTNPCSPCSLWFRLDSVDGVDVDVGVSLVCYLTDEQVVIARRYVVVRSEAFVVHEGAFSVRQISANTHIRFFRQGQGKILHGDV